MMRKKTGRPALALIALLLSSTATFAAQYVVVEARGVALKAGATLDAGQPLILQQGQHVTLISDTGVTLKIDGPYNKPPSAAASGGVDVASTLKGLGTEQQARLGEAGATRSDKACIEEGQQPIFWRAQPNAAARLAIQPSDRSWKAEAQWPAGQSRISLATPVVIHGNATYFVSFNGTESAITMNTIPASLTTDRMRAAWMADKGCEAQAEALLRTLQ